MGGIVQWFVKNPIAANILMLGLIFGGWVGSGNIKKEVFPTSEQNIINVNMKYLGAAPREVEQQIVIRIEEAIAGLPGIFKINSSSQQDQGLVSIEVIKGYDVKEVLSDIKARVDAINTFPASSERPIISQQVYRNTLLWFSISGDVSKGALKKIGYQIRDELTLLEGVSEVIIHGLILDEVSIEISEANLQRYKLTFSEISAAIRNSSINVPAGEIRTEEGNIQIQTRSQAQNEQDFANIVIRSGSDGSQLILSDIAKINDGFSEQERDFITGTKPGLNFEVKMSDDPKLFAGTINASGYLEKLKSTLPKGLELKTNGVSKDLFDARFNLLKDNALSGLLLVFIILMLFLRPLLALWVVIGIVTAFCGAVWLLPYFGISLNMLSMFAFLMVLGIVVDDAIIVGESIYSQQKKGLQGHKSAIIGTKTVLMPVMLAVVSTIIFFMPMVDVPKDVEPFTTSIFFVVCFCLIFSLVESLLILPTHLAHMKPEKPSSNKLLRSVERIRYSCSVSLERFTAGTYRSLLNKFLQRKVSTILAFIMVFAISLAMLFAGWVKSAFFPQVPQPFLSLDASFPEGSPYRYTTDLADYMKKQANSLNKNPALLAKNSGLPFIVEVNTNSNGNQLNVFVGLTPAEERNVSIEAVKIKLQELIGPLPEVQNYSLASSIGDNNPDIELNLRLFSNSVNTQEQATNDITKILATYDGINNVRSNLDTGRLEAELELKDYAQTLGISTSDIATQVRQAFHGEELQRIPRSKEDVRVVLRFTESERRSLDTLDDMQIRTDKGHEIPLSSVADVSLVPSSSIIRRTDRIRNITITADITEGVNANQIITEMLASYGQEWKYKYTGFELSTDGNLRTQSEFGDNFLENFLLAFIIAFSLFAIAFKSIFAPLLILTAVPFGFMGAIFGHIIWSGVTGTDYNISMMSFFGFLACAGVVVNDNLVLLARIKHLRTKGYSAFEAVLNAGTDRFRAIILTSLTTFIGLLPILFERSTQSQFLIPMVISLAFGVLFASVVTLFMVPCVYLSGYSIGQRIQRLNKGIVTKVRGSTVAS